MKTEEKIKEEREKEEYCPIHFVAYERKYPYGWSKKICRDCELSKTL